MAIWYMYEFLENRFNKRNLCTSFRKKNVYVSSITMFTYNQRAQHFQEFGVEELDGRDM
jgi:hypothetical protein